jgi:hypothetical protein
LILVLVDAFAPFGAAADFARHPEIHAARLGAQAVAGHGHVRLHVDVVVDLAFAQPRGAELLEPAADAVAADVNAALADLHRAAVGEEVCDVVPQLAIDVVAVGVLQVQDVVLGRQLLDGRLERSETNG